MDLTLFANPVFQQLSAPAILAIVVLLVLTGWLVPKRMHDRIIAEKEAAHAINLAQSNKRGDEWKESDALKAEVIKEQNEIIAVMAKAMQTPAEFFETVQAEGGGDRVGS